MEETLNANENAGETIVDQTLAAVLAIDECATPAKGPGVAVREECEEDGKYLIYEPESEAILLMNATGRRIFDLCTGAKSIREIAADLAVEYQAAEGVDLLAVVRDYISILAKTRLITFK